MTFAAVTVGETLRRARASGIDRLDAQLLLAHVLERPRSWLLAHDDDVLTSAQAAAAQEMLARRADGEPLAYLTGTKAFHRLMLQVNADVLVPRPDTEVLVDWALELLACEWPQVRRPRVVDLGTGSGAIALALKHSHPAADLLATDVSPAALAVARRNAEHLRLDATLLESDWWEALTGRRFHLVVSNPPYIAGADPHLEALRHEPAIALTPHGDGLAALRQIVAGASDHLEPGGWLLLEHGFDQAPAVQALLDAAGFLDLRTRSDLGGQSRCTGGHR
ncbi:MAG: peptide chain release factor N(5)-glutamine methyltransferase [Burkholderiaceae bacterium]